MSRKPKTVRSRLAAVLLLLLCGSQWGAVSSESPVADAAMRGDVEEIRSLIDQGADIDAPQGDGMTALHWSAETGNVEMARVLLEAGAATDAVTRNGAYTPLHLAARSGSAQVVEVLLEAPELDRHGYIVDIVDLETNLEDLVDYFKDQTLNNLPEFKELNPSIEHFCRIFLKAISGKIKANNLTALTVKFWENEIAWTSYREKFQAGS